MLTTIALLAVLAPNPFEMKPLPQPYMLSAKKAKEGKCGQGRCGTATPKDVKKPRKR